MFSVRGLRLYFPHAGALGCAVCFALPLFLPVYLCVNVGPQGLPATTLWGLLAAAWPASFHNLPPRGVHQPLPFCESSPSGCPSPPLLLVWMNVSSLSPWLSDFHTVRFSVSSGCFLFLNCCCPSFGCARRDSVSTYSSILARSYTSYTSLHQAQELGKCLIILFSFKKKRLLNVFIEQHPDPRSSFHRDPVILWALAGAWQMALASHPGVLRWGWWAVSHLWVPQCSHGQAGACWDLSYHLGPREARSHCDAHTPHLSSTWCMAVSTWQSTGSPLWVIRPLTDCMDLALCRQHAIAGPLHSKAS